LSHIARSARAPYTLRVALKGPDPWNPTEADCRVRPEDLGEIDKIHALLRALNDPMANIAKLVAAVRVLSARCVRRARLKSISREVTSMEQALRIIGNKGTEQELLGVLEDLTVLKAESEA
jgi:hypothetical protein